MNKSRAIPEAALQIVREFEGLSFVAYPDPATKGKPYTVGYGHTAGVFKDTHIDKAMAEKLLLLDLQEAAKPILKWVKIELNDNEFSALLSFVFNLGAGSFTNSTLLKLLNEGDKQGAADQFLRWNKAAGKVMKGLTRRRAAERDLFLKSVQIS
jgi:lysozyme